MPPLLLGWLFRCHVPSRHYRLLLDLGLDSSTPWPVLVQTAAGIRGGNSLAGKQSMRYFLTDPRHPNLLFTS